jgi:hypothetical protein
MQTHDNALNTKGKYSILKQRILDVDFRDRNSHMLTFLVNVAVWRQDM